MALNSNTNLRLVRMWRAEEMWSRDILVNNSYDAIHSIKKLQRIKIKEV